MNSTMASSNATCVILVITLPPPNKIKLTHKNVKIPRKLGFQQLQELKQEMLQYVTNAPEGPL